MRMEPGKYVIMENIIGLSEVGKKKLTVRKIVQNWPMVIFVSLALLTAKVAAEQLVMLIRP